MVTIKSMAQTKRKRDLLITRIAFILDTSLSSALIVLSPSFISFQIAHSSLISLTYGHSPPGGEVMAITNLPAGATISIIVSVLLAIMAEASKEAAADGGMPSPSFSSARAAAILAGRMEPMSGTSGKLSISRLEFSLRVLSSNPELIITPEMLLSGEMQAPVLYQNQ